MPTAFFHGDFVTTHRNDFRFLATAGGQIKADADDNDFNPGERQDGPQADDGERARDTQTYNRYAKKGQL